MKVLAKKERVAWRDALVAEQARDSRDVLVGEKARGIPGQESGSHEDVEPFTAIELEDIADTVKHLATDAAIAGFKATEGAVVDFGELSNLFLGQTAFGTEPGQELAKIFAWTRCAATAR